MVRLGFALLFVSLGVFAQDKNSKVDVDPYLQNEVKNTLVKRSKQLQTCYLEYLKKNPVLKEGSIKVDWQITKTGKVMKPEIVESTLHDAAFEKCMLTQIARIEFPPLGSTTPKYVAHVFLFKDEKNIERSKNDPKK